jgi:hypothetical protein
MWVRVNGRIIRVSPGQWFRDARTNRMRRAPVIEQPAQQPEEVPEEQPVQQEEEVAFDEQEEEEQEEVAEVLSNVRHTPYNPLPQLRDLQRIFRALTQERIDVLMVDFVDTSRCLLVVHGAEELIYNVEIRQFPRCSCMDRRYRGISCKHIMHALISIFAVDIDSHLLWQRSFTEREVHDIINPLIDVN